MQLRSLHPLHMHLMKAPPEHNHVLLRPCTVLGAAKLAPRQMHSHSCGGLDGSHTCAQHTVLRPCTGLIRPAVEAMRVHSLSCIVHQEGNGQLSARVSSFCGGCCEMAAGA